MKTINSIFFHCLVISSVLAGVPAKAGQFGVGYGREFKENTRIEQYEVFHRQPLPWQRQFDSGLRLSSDLEFAAALIREAGGDNEAGGRFSIMPQMVLGIHPKINLLFGLGVGFMVGDTAFAGQDLGGEFLLNGKVGIQVLLGEHWQIGYCYYHQSNADIYDSNQGLNLNTLLLSYSFP